MQLLFDIAYIFDSIYLLRLTTLTPQTFGPFLTTIPYFIKFSYMMLYKIRHFCTFFCIKSQKIYEFKMNY